MRTSSLKKILSLMLSLVMVLGVCFAAIPGEAEAAEGVLFTVSADKQELHRGDEVTVTVSMSGNTKAYGLTYELCYDPAKVELVGKPARGEAYSGLDPDENEQGSCSATSSNSVMALIARTVEPISNGTLMTVKFKVLSDSSFGNAGFSYQILTADGEQNPQPVSYENEETLSEIQIVNPATGIALDKSAVTVAKNQTEQLTAVLTPADSTSKVTWTSSDDTVAAVDGRGLVTAKKVGEATITAMVEGYSASCKVTVNNPLNGISIQSDDNVKALKKGQTTTLKVVYDPEDTTDNKTVNWSSSDEKVATVDQNGLVTAVADGTVTITARVGNKTASYDMTIQEIKLTAIGLDENASVHKGDIIKLTVTYEPDNTTDSKKVSWSSSDPSVATVNGDGTVTGVGAGKAKIKAKVGNFEKECEVTVDAPLKAIVPDKTSIDLVKNQTAKITYTFDPADTTDSKEVTFASSKPEVAAVSETGEVAAKQAGETVITLTGANGITAQVTVKVTEIAIDSVTLNKATAVVEKGESVALTATVGPENTTDENKTITWKSSDESIATVAPASTESSEEAIVTATGKGGKTVITATAWNGTKAECEIIVPIHVESITLPETVTLNKGKTQVLEVTYNPENAEADEKAVKWASSDPSVASVDTETGTVTAHKEGVAEITATTTKTGYPITATTKVTVKEIHLDQELASKIAFAEIKDPLLKGQTIELRPQLNVDAIIEEYQITDTITIEWSSSDKEIADVDQMGAVLGVKAGDATITASITAKDAAGNVIGVYNVSTGIQIKEIPLESITFDKVITEMQEGAAETLGIIYNPEDTTDLKDVEWFSSDTSVLTVEDGKITAVKAGEAEITAKVGELSVTCKITVKPVQKKDDSQQTGGTGANAQGKNTTQGTGIKTGDTSNVALYTVLLLISAAVLMIFCGKRNRKARR